MTKIKSIMCAVACAALALVSCDNINENDRYLDYDSGVVVPPGNDDDDNNDDNRPTSVQRGVLIEDFTGQMCVNCPNAVPVIEQLEEAYGNLVVPVGIHAGMVLPTTLGTLALQTETGEQYYKDAGSPAQPAGRINRSSTTYLPAMWIAQAQNVLRQQSPVWLNIINEYDVATRKVSVNVEAYGVDAASGNIQIWLTEDGIVAPQFLPAGGSDMNYVHNHVFRVAVNGANGEPFTIGKGEDKTVTAEAELAEHWVPENMSVVAFVYNADGVLHVVKKPVTAKDASQEKTGSGE